MKRTQVSTNKPVYLGWSMLETTKIVMYNFWYDYVKLKYGEKASLCYINTDSFIIFITSKDIYSDIEKDLETGFDTLNYI